MVESLATFYFENRKQESEMMQFMLRHHQACPDLFSYFLQTLFQVLLFVPSANHWTLSGALFALILLDTTVRLSLSLPQVHMKELMSGCRAITSLLTKSSNHNQQNDTMSWSRRSLGSFTRSVEICSQPIGSVSPET